MDGLLLEHIIFTLFFALTFGLFLGSILFHIRVISRGKPEPLNRFDNIGARIWDLLVFVLCQKRMFKDWYSGILHALIFWGFLAHVVSNSDMIIRGIADFTFSFGDVPIIKHAYLPWIAVEDFFAAIVVVAIVLALLRRLIAKPARYQKKPAPSFDAYAILGFILVHMILLMITWALEIKSNFPGAHGDLRPLSKTLGAIMPVDTMVAGETAHITWWVHAVVVFTFIMYITPLSSAVKGLGVSKHIHILFSITNVFFRQRPKDVNKLSKLEINLESEEEQTFGVQKVEEFTWRQAMDFYACLNCGRCAEQCPANITGKKLSPRDLIVNMRLHYVRKSPYIFKGISAPPAKDAATAQTAPSANQPETPAVLNEKLIGEIVTPEELWACTTCGACSEACPVFVEHIQKIVDLRRNLVLSESSAPKDAENMFRSLENNFNPYSQGYTARFNWAEGKDVPLFSQKKDAEYLFYVGCAGSFDPRGIKITLAVTDILKRAGVSFAVLGTEEQCCGDTARRMGNEYLAQTLIEANVAKFKEYNVKKIIVACPHGYNIFKKEYRDYGGDFFEVIYAGNFILDLVQSGRLKLNTPLNSVVAFHDSCYLGRYNGIYDEPRELLNSVPGVKIVEMERSRAKSFCCGGGGGWNFMDEKEGKRLNVERAEQMLATGASVVASCCPFCMSMFEDGLKAKNAEEKVKSLSIFEIIAQSSAPKA
jgi:Fe-S oxidoreductase